MKRRLIIRPEAGADIEDITDWYDEQRPGLGDRFLERLKSLLDRIVEWPRQFPEIVRGVRRGLLDQFPYHVYFRLDGDDVVVFAVIHQRRHPDSWRYR